jgi:pyruvate/2-oxoglutarate/acetoin dehydrogenase E1 component
MKHTHVLSLMVATLAVGVSDDAFDFLDAPPPRVKWKDVVSPAAALLERPRRAPSVEEVLRDAGRLFR